MQSNTTPDRGHQIESDKNTRKHNIQKSQEVSPSPAGDYKAARTRKRQYDGQTQITQIIHKRRTALERSEESKVANRDWVDHQSCSLLQYINVIANLFIMGNYFINGAEKIIRAKCFFFVYFKKKLYT